MKKLIALAFLLGAFVGLSQASSDYKPTKFTNAEQAIKKLAEIWSTHFAKTKTLFADSPVQKKAVLFAFLKDAEAFIKDKAHGDKDLTQFIDPKNKLYISELFAKVTNGLSIAYNLRPTVGKLSSEEFQKFLNSLDENSKAIDLSRKTLEKASFYLDRADKLQAKELLLALFGTADALHYKTIKDFFKIRSEAKGLPLSPEALATPFVADVLKKGGVAPSKVAEIQELARKTPEKIQNVTGVNVASALQEGMNKLTPEQVINILKQVSSDPKDLELRLENIPAPPKLGTAKPLSKRTDGKWEVDLANAEVQRTLRDVKEDVAKKKAALSEDARKLDELKAKKLALKRLAAGYGKENEVEEW